MKVRNMDYLKKAPFAITLSMTYVLLFLACASNPKTNNERRKVHSRYAQVLQLHKWRSALIGINTQTDQYELIVEKDSLRSYGDFTVFSDSIHFHSYYSAPCGNDCFTSVYGTYHFTDSSAIQLFVDSIEYWGECSSPTIYPDTIIGEFDIKASAMDTLLLIKK